MLRRFRRASALLSLASAATVLVEAAPAFAAAWKTNVNYGGSTKMDLYVPDSPAASPPIVVALHYCSGNAGNAHGWLQSYADMYGFAIITPQAGGNCFDAAPTRSGERAAIVSMVNYVVMQNNGDAKRVYSVGASSGACMTQALLAAYPDVFAAGSSLAGVPAGAWTGGNDYAWSTSGTSGGQGWGDKVRNADPGFSGTRPRIQLWHGQGDTTLTYSQAYPAEVAQWTNVFGVTDADGTLTSVKPPGAQDTWARTSYKDESGTVVVEANSGPSNVPHDLTGRGLWADVVRFFGLDMKSTGSGGMGGMGGAAGNPSAGSAGSGTSAGGTGSGGRSASGGTGPTGTGGMGTGGTGMASAGAGNGGTMAAAGTGGSGMPTAGTGTGAAGMAPATGGATSTGGNPGSGGTTGGTTMTGSGGTATAGKGTVVAGAANTAGSNAGDDDDDTGGDGCGCRVGSSSAGTDGAMLAALALGALGVVARRRRR